MSRVAVGGLYCLGIDACLTRCVRSQGPQFDKVRWFTVHALANWSNAILTFPAVLSLLRDPLNALLVDAGDELLSVSSKWPMSITMALHLYHIACFRLTVDDWFHHTLFLPTIGLTGVVYHWGCFGNWLCFFMCGFPGAVDYTLLALHKSELCLNWNQKRTSANMNVWCRMPGVTTSIGVAYVLWCSGRYACPAWAFWMQMALLSFNVLYYTKSSVISYVLAMTKPYLPAHETWAELKKNL